MTRYLVTDTDIRSAINAAISEDVRDAYIAGRTAEPCKEQIEAAAKVLAD